MAEVFNPNELIIERIKEIVFQDLETLEVNGRLTQIEDGTLDVTAESDEVTDARGTSIDTIYRAKSATLSATNSLFSFDLAANQIGAKKVRGTSDDKIAVTMTEIVEVKNNRADLSKTPVDGSIKYVYKLVDNGIAEKFTRVESTPQSEQFTLTGKQLAFPAGVSGKFYVIYQYEAAKAVKITNNSENFPETVKATIIVVFKDVCNPNKKYYGIIECPKAKIDPTSISIALSATGKHAFNMSMKKDYCDVEANLFSIVIPGE